MCGMRQKAGFLPMIVAVDMQGWEVLGEGAEGIFVRDRFVVFMRMIYTCHGSL